MRNLVILGGSSHPTLTKAICARLGVTEGKAILGKFSNGETHVQIQESIRGKDVFIITTGCGEINEILMELFIMLNACKIASARSNGPPIARPLRWGIVNLSRGYYSITSFSVLETAGCAVCTTGYAACARSCYAFQGFCDGVFVSDTFWYGTSIAIRWVETNDG